MIEGSSDIFVAVVELESLTQWGGLLKNSHVMRKRVCVDDLGWTMPYDDGIYESDEYDTLGTAVYLIVTKDGITPLAMSRLMPTTRPHLMEKIYPKASIQPISDEHIWEISRMMVAPENNLAIKINAIKALETAIDRFSRNRNISTFIGWVSDATYRMLRTTSMQYQVIASLDDFEGNPTKIIQYDMASVEYEEEFRQAISK